MKITKQLLQKIIKEELTGVIAESDMLADFGISPKEYESVKYLRQSRYGKNPDGSPLVSLQVEPDGSIVAEYEDGITVRLEPKRPDYEPHGQW